MGGYRNEERKKELKAAAQAARVGKSDVNMTTFVGPDDDKNLEVCLNSV